MIFDYTELHRDIFETFIHWF